MNHDEVPDVTELIPSIKVHPFPQIWNFNHLGMIVSTDHNGIVMSRKAFLICPICSGLDDFYNCEMNMHYKAHYCKGNEEPEIKCGDHTHRVACAGINHPHFHVLCGCCSNVFFLEVPGEK